MASLTLKDRLKRTPRGVRRYPRRVPRKPPNRTTDSAVLVRLTSEQRKKIDEALAKIARPGLRPVVSRFLLESALVEADRILAGKK